MRMTVLIRTVCAGLESVRPSKRVLLGGRGVVILIIILIIIIIISCIYNALNDVLSANRSSSVQNVCSRKQSVQTVIGGSCPVLGHNYYYYDVDDRSQALRECRRGASGTDQESVVWGS